MSDEEKARDASGFILYFDSLSQKHEFIELSKKLNKGMRDMILEALTEKYGSLKSK